MALAVDASTPAKVTGSGNPISTASFTPPAGALILVLATYNTTGTPSPVTVSSVGSAMSFTASEHMEKALDGSTSNGAVTVHWGITPDATARTVQVQWGTNAMGLYVVVLTGADTTTPIGNTGRGFSGTNAITPTGYTSSVNNSRGFSVWCDWNDLGVATSSDTLVDLRNTGAISGAAVYKAADTATSGTAVTFNIDGAGTGTPQWQWAAVEVRPAAGGGGSVSSTAAWTEADDSWAVAAAETITATAAWTEADDTVVSAAAETITNSAAWTEADDTVAAAAAEAISSTSSWLEDDDAWAVVVTMPGAVSIAWTEEDDVWVAVAAQTALPVTAYRFVTPTAEEQAILDAATGLSWTRSVGITVIKTAGTYRQVRHPKQAELEAADEYYLGGHAYTVDPTEAAALTAAGYSEYLTPA